MNSFIEKFNSNNNWTTKIYQNVMFKKTQNKSKYHSQLFPNNDESDELIHRLLQCFSRKDLPSGIMPRSSLIIIFCFFQRGISLGVAFSSIFFCVFFMRKSHSMKSSSSWEIIKNMDFVFFLNCVTWIYAQCITLIYHRDPHIFPLLITPVFLPQSLILNFLIL